jgi:hypothetical protein
MPGSQLHSSMRLPWVISGNGGETLGVDGLYGFGMMLFGVPARSSDCLASGAYQGCQADQCLHGLTQDGHLRGENLTQSTFSQIQQGIELGA